MTYLEREQIFSKEVLTIKDMSLLLDVNYNDSAKLIRDIKTSLKLKGGVRLDIQGKLHTQDYLDYFNISNLERYKKLKDDLGETV